MAKDSEEPPKQEDQPADPLQPVEPSPPFQPDPELITYLEREAKPGEVRVWRPDRESLGA